MATGTIKRDKVPTYLVTSKNVSLAAATSQNVVFNWSDFTDIKNTDEVIFAVATAGTTSAVYVGLDMSLSINTGAKPQSGVLGTVRAYSPTATTVTIYMRVLVLR